MKKLPAWLVNIYALESLQWHAAVNADGKQRRTVDGKHTLYDIKCALCKQTLTDGHHQHPDGSAWNSEDYLDNAKWCRKNHGYGRYGLVARCGACQEIN